jgi:hypothetical protein
LSVYKVVGSLLEKWPGERILTFVPNH